jgi:glycosyltransferase involved in cell wall biosynthesis
MLHIYAPNIFSGGGYTLLKKIIVSVDDLIKNLTFHVDERCPDSDKLLLKKQYHHFFKAGFLSHFLYEYKLSKTLTCEDKLLSFSNRPLLFKPKCINIIFVQNFYIFLSDIHIRMKWTAYLKYFFLRFLIKKVSKNRNVLFVVQNFVMRDNLIKLGIEESLIRLLPFYEEITPEVVTSKLFVSKKFVYPAAGVDHKNHIALIQAWILVKGVSSDHELHITLDDFFWNKLKKKLKLTDELINNFKIINHGVVSQDQMAHLYSNADCLIYPSLFESFGLPLLEASQLNIDIIAAELDYIRDLPVKVSQTFDPNSYISVARAIQRYIGLPTNQLNIMAADQFLKQLSLVS